MVHEFPPFQPGEMLPPTTVWITPSKIDPWRGARAEGAFFTYGQLDQLPTYQLDPETCDFVIVRSPASMREMWWPKGSPAPVFLLPCPIVSRRADGSQLLVIAPYGMKKWVYADGSITRRTAAAPSRRNYRA